jgi:hypothetical protein
MALAHDKGSETASGGLVLLLDQREGAMALKSWNSGTGFCD